jgi:hypothetical protein
LVPPPPSSGAVPPPPPAPGAAVPGNQSAPTTKKLHWKPIKRLDRKNSIWNSMTDLDINNDLIKFSELEENFSRSESTKSFTSKLNNKNEEKNNSKKENEGFLDDKLARNIEIIMTSQFKSFSNKNLIKYINEFDIKNLNCDKVQNLENVVKIGMNVFKTKDMNLFLEKKDSLTDGEKFVLDISSVNNVMSKLRVMKYMFQFDSYNESTMKLIKEKYRACKTLFHCLSLRKILHYVLTIGNTMNGSTRHMAAKGFHLHILPKLADTRSTKDSSMSLMNYLVSILEKEQTDVYYFEVDLETGGVCTSGVQITVNTIEKLWNEQREMFQEIEELLNSQKQKVNNGKDSKSLKKLKKFYDSCNKTFAQTTKHFKELTDLYEQCCKFFHFDPNATSVKEKRNENEKDELFRIIKQFIDNYKKARKQNEQKQKNSKPTGNFSMSFSSNNKKRKINNNNKNSISLSQISNNINVSNNNSNDKELNNSDSDSSSNDELNDNEAIEIITLSKEELYSKKKNFT